MHVFVRHFSLSFCSSLEVLSSHDLKLSSDYKIEK